MASTHAMSEIIDNNNGRRPTLSMSSHGMKEATKNQVCRKPAMRPEKCWSKPMDFWKSVPE